ncbi:MAG: hypothetical protein A3F13_04475 [Gammaproteobacteria bacterium RIFCSPHIGHO2_12_FULL_40_19]|nr:MAG: hypothetical protein A3F13_04475 [Gammaproteobacteria bacterium RIFCSPHIGHO2_12_FULL_40_19]
MRKFCAFALLAALVNTTYANTSPLSPYIAFPADSNKTTIQLQQFVPQRRELHTDEVGARLGDRIIMNGGIDVFGFTSKMQNPLVYTGPANEALHLRVAYFDFYAMFYPWLTTYLSITDEPNYSSTTIATTPIPKISQAYIRMTSQNDAQVRFTLGRTYLPFGVYSKYAIIASFVHKLSEMTNIAAIVDLNYKPFFGSVYAFNMEGTLNGFGNPPSSQIENGGAEVGLTNLPEPGPSDSSIVRFPRHQFGYAAQVSLVNNLAANNTIFNIISSTNRAVDAMNARIELIYYGWGIIANDIFALRPFLTKDITYNGAGAEPSAQDIALNYLFRIHSKPLLAGLKYEQSAQALFLSMGRFQYEFSLTYGINRFLSTSLQLYRSRNYASNDTGTYATGTSSFTTITGNNAWNDTAIVDLFAHF